MEVQKGKLDGLLILTPRVFADARGFFIETYRETVWGDLGLPRFVQDNQSRSTKNVLRGIHLSLAGEGQGKLVRCARGRVWDVAVDLRRSSKTFGQWQATELDDQGHVQVFIPPGFGHGFCVLSEVADVTYKMTSYYTAEGEIGLRWDDSDLDIAWPIREPLLSERDLTNSTLSEIYERLPE